MREKYKQIILFNDILKYKVSILRSFVRLC